jgi:hypothetical protein
VTEEIWRLGKLGSRDGRASHAPGGGVSKWRLRPNAARID